MSSTRAVVVLVIATVVYGVQFAVDQWVLLHRRLPADPGRAVRPGDDAGQPVPDVGPRGVPPDPAADRAGLLRVAASTSRSPASGFLGALALATIPLAVGLDAMRQLAFVGSEFPIGTPPPEVEALILVAMTVVFLGAARWMLRDARADGAPGRPPVGALAVSAGDVRRSTRRAGLGSPEWGGFDRSRRAGTTAPTIAGARSGPRPASAGRWRPTGPTRSCSSSTRWPSRSRRR